MESRSIPFFCHSIVRRLLNYADVSRLASRAGLSSAACGDEVEGEIDQTGAPALGGLLHKLERCHAIRTNTAKFAVEIGEFHCELRESGRCRAIFGGPVEAPAGEELNGAVLDPRRHAIAVEFDFVDS